MCFMPLMSVSRLAPNSRCQMFNRGRVAFDGPPFDATGKRFVSNIGGLVHRNRL